MPPITEAAIRSVTIQKEVMNAIFEELERKVEKLKNKKAGGHAAE